MKVSSKLAKWAYAFNVLFGRTPYSEYIPSNVSPYGQFTPRSAYPKSINLCNLFWRAFVLTPLMGLGGIFIVGGLLTFLRDYLPYIFAVVLGTGAVGALAIGVIWLAEKYGWGGKFVTAADGIIDAKLWGKLREAKGKVCPIFETEE